MPDRRADMPQEYSQADAEWIQQQLLSLTPAVRQKAIQRYAAVYQETFEAEPVSYRKENRARHEANTASPVRKESRQGITGVYRRTAPGWNASAFLIVSGLKVPEQKQA